MDGQESTAELLQRWRDATHAAELAERLAVVAAQTAERADQSAATSERIAKMAEQAAASAERAASQARKAATLARTFATDHRGVGLGDAATAVDAARAEETAARDQYHEAEAAVRTRQDGG